MSVSPLEDEGDDLEEVGDNLLLPSGEVMGEAGERLEVQTEEGSVKKLLDPQLPSAEKVEMHILMGHIPYRNWCWICVMAMGRGNPHKKDEGGERRLPEYSWDFCFPGDEMGLSGPS